MDIKNVSPEEYVDWLRTQGVKPEEMRHRLAHDMLRALLGQLNDLGTPDGFEDFKSQLDEVLAHEAVDRAKRQ